MIIVITTSENTAIEKLKIEVMDPTVPYFESKPIYPSQELESQEESSSFFSFQLIPNYELEQLLLSFGENVRVIEPAYFREQIKARAERLKAKYNE